MSVLVTGGAGFIGSHLCERLLERGRVVVSVDNYDDFYDPGIKMWNLTDARDHRSFLDVHGDIRDPVLLGSLPDTIDTVVHLAARAGVRPSIEHPVLYHDVNVHGTVLLLEWMRRRGIRRLVFASSSSVYGNSAKVPFSEDEPVSRPISPYASTKVAGEALTHVWHRLHETGVVCLRFFTVYGPRQRPDLAIHKFARLLARGRPLPVYGDGSSERDYTYITDILQGVEGALGYLDARPGAFEIVNLGESRTVSLKEMIAVLSRALGVHPELQHLPEQPGDVDRTYADVSKARRLFGYEPSTPFPEGIRRFVEWFRREHAVAPHVRPGGSPRRGEATL